MAIDKEPGGCRAHAAYETPMIKCGGCIMHMQLEYQILIKFGSMYGLMRCFLMRDNVTWGVSGVE